MIRWVRCLALIVLTLTLTSCSSYIMLSSSVASSPASSDEIKTRPTADLIQTEQAETVAVLHKRKNMFHLCGGVWVGNNAILTAAHCVEHDDEIAKAGELHYTLQSEMQDIKHIVRWHRVSILAIDKGHDLALLRAEGKIPAHPVAELATENPGVGEKVAVIGHVDGLIWTYMEGTVAGYRGYLPRQARVDGPYLQVQAPVYFGSSGGGCFDRDGKLVGIASFISERAPGMGFFAPLQFIHKFMHKHLVYH